MDAAAGTEHCTELLDWVSANVPGNPDVKEIICDFATEFAKQGRGDGYATTAVRKWQAEHPGTKIVPLPPRSQHLNLAESLGWRTVHRFAAANAARAHLGPLARSIVQRGAVHQANMTAARCPPPSAHGKGGKGGTGGKGGGEGRKANSISRVEALLGRRPVASNTIGYCGQECYVTRADAKWSAFEPAKELALYVKPAEGLSGQLVLLLRTLKLTVVPDATMSTDPDVHAATLARSVLFQPTGAYAAPTGDAHARALSDLLVPTTGHPDYTLVGHNPATGLPDHLTYLIDGPPEPTQPHAAAPTVAVAAGANTRAWGQFKVLPGATRIVFDPDGKKRNGAAPESSSRKRYKIYCVAQTLDQYHALHPGPPGLPNADLKNDYGRGLIQLAPVRVIGPAAAIIPGGQAEASPTAACLRGWSFAHAAEGPTPPSKPDPAAALVAPAYKFRPHVASVEAELLAALEEEHPTPLGPASDRAHIVPPAALLFAGPGAPASMRDALARPDWEGPDGWRESMGREVSRIVDKHRALTMVPVAARNEAIRKYGGDKVSTGYIIVVFKRRQRRGHPHQDAHRPGIRPAPRVDPGPRAPRPRYSRHPPTGRASPRRGGSNRAGRAGRIAGQQPAAPGQRSGDGGQTHPPRQPTGAAGGDPPQAHPGPAPRRRIRRTRLPRRVRPPGGVRRHVRHDHRPGAPHRRSRGLPTRPRAQGLLVLGTRRTDARGGRTPGRTKMDLPEGTPP